MKRRADELPVVMQDEGVEIRAEQFGEMRCTLFKLPAGFNFDPFFAGLPDDACPVPHWGRVLEGEITLTYTDGTEETTRAGELYHWPAGHKTRTDDGVVLIDFGPEDITRRVVEHVAAQSAG
jgi:hypothetical protein